ncbi:MAG TPA: solute-binding protein [Caldilineae bacterium]|nr:solute-binding protein [Caldilineae bacterium]
MRRVLSTLFTIMVLVVACAYPPVSPVPSERQDNRLILATTTSTADSGLLDAILPDFEAKYHAQVDVIAVGTGQAMQIGKAGDADVILVHARSAEEAFVAEGYGAFREDVMYNDFVIVGPPDDPAGIRGMKDAIAALKKIAETQARFISRGDDSGTHKKEMSLWKEAGIEPGGDWYVSAGQGMGAVLTMANEQMAYTLTDRGTYLARRRPPPRLDLEIMMEGDPRLFNPYGVIPINPERHPGVNYDLAVKFVEWLTSVETQEKIAQFGVDRFGQPLFYPNSRPWREQHGE